MRVLNDKEEKAQPQELGFFGILIHSFLIAMGMATVVLAPMPILVAHLRLTEPWPKIATLVGALLALMGLFQVPLPLVLIGFAFGLYVADQVVRGVSFWRVILSAPLVAAVAGVASIFLAAQLERVGVGSYWNGLIQTWVTLAEKQWGAEGLKLQDVMQYISQQGPFVYLSGAIVSAWLSIGIVAHLGWFQKGHPYSATELRKISVPAWIAPLFVLFFSASYVAPLAWRPYAEGVGQVISTLLFIQGCVALSKILRKRNVKAPIRSLMYSMGVSFGFFILVGLGILNPWLNVKTRKA
jgi:hypothetical protein